MLLSGEANLTDRRDAPPGRLYKSGGGSGSEDVYRTQVKPAISHTAIHLAHGYFEVM
jgi:hypothetical protein